MKTFNKPYEVHHISIEEYKNAFKHKNVSFQNSMLNKNGRFFKDGAFFMRFTGILFLFLVFFVALLAF